MSYFVKSSLSDSLKVEMVEMRIWAEDCPISLDRLNLLNLSYVDFEGVEHNDGKMVVLDVVAEKVLDIFKQLFIHKFPINSIKLINDYAGNDDKSMAANNSSAFNYRKVLGTNDLSIHSYGLAIDVNPLQNPYVTNYYEVGKTEVAVYPAEGMKYMNRINIRKGMVESSLNDKYNVVELFKQNGFGIWGGSWNEPLDWHHFQLSREHANILSKLSFEEGLEFFNNNIVAK